MRQIFLGPRLVSKSGAGLKDTEKKRQGLPQCSFPVFPTHVTQEKYTLRQYISTQCLKLNQGQSQGIPVLYFTLRTWERCTTNLGFRVLIWPLRKSSPSRDKCSRGLLRTCLENSGSDKVKGAKQSPLRLVSFVSAFACLLIKYKA